MPNLKIFVDESAGAEGKSRLANALPSLREFLCRQLSVDPALAQLAIVPVLRADRSGVASCGNRILPSPQRTPEHLAATGEALRDRLNH